MIIPVILAGGRGERFWPYSNQNQPKQLLPLVTSQTLLEDTLAHLDIWKNRGPILIIAAKHLEAPIRALLKKKGARKDIILVGEPRGRNTAAAIALACKIIQNIDPKAVMAVVTADHAITPTAALAKAFDVAAKVANQGKDLVTFGIRPSRPETGYGYIEIKGEEQIVAGLPTYAVKRFAEKPAAAQARKFIASGKFFWNSGLFAWRTDVVWELFKSCLPAMYQTFENAGSFKPGSTSFNNTLKKVYDNIEGESVDYGIMEKAPSIKVVIPKFSWDDIGAWSALDRIRPADKTGNRLLGNATALDCEGVTVFNTEGLVATFGLKDVLVVQHNGVTMVCPKEKSPELKKLVAQVGLNAAWAKYL